VFNCAEVRTKNGMSVNESSLNWNLHKSFHSLSPIELKMHRPSRKKYYISCNLMIIHLNWNFKPLNNKLIKLLLESKFL